jgi:hypothetical protein
VLHKKYMPNLEAGREQEDRVATYWQVHLGIPLTIWGSQKQQQHCGESLQGVEVKLDRRFPETGHLAIEIAERPDVTYEFSAAGPYHEIKPEILIIGNQDKVWEFIVCNLCDVIETSEYRVTQTNTAELVLIPIADADLIGTSHDLQGFFAEYEGCWGC